MILFISTTNREKIIIALKKNNKVIRQIEEPAEKTQSEKLLFVIDKILKQNKNKLIDLKAIEVENQGNSFTALRIGILTANALGYALNIPVYETGQTLKTKRFKPLVPKYDSEPKIGR